MSEPFLSSSMHFATGFASAAGPAPLIPAATRLKPHTQSRRVIANPSRRACRDFRCVDFASAAKSKEDETRNGNPSSRQPIAQKSIARA